MSNQIAGQRSCQFLRSSPGPSANRSAASRPRRVAWPALAVSPWSSLAGLLAGSAVWARRLALVLVVWLAPTAVVYAQDYAAAGQHFDAAQEAFQKGEFKRAAQEYQAAHAITKDPALLFSIGESLQRAGEPQKALEAYRAYLREQPTASDRPEVEKRIRALEEALVPAPGPAPVSEPAVSPGQTPTTASTPSGTATPGQTAASPSTSPGPVAPGSQTKPEAKPEAKADTKPDTTPAPQVMPPGEKPTVLRTAAWVGTAAAVALGTAGAIVGLGAQNRADELRRRTTLLIGNVPPAYDENQAEAYTTLMSEGQSYNSASIALLSAAGVATVVSVVLFVIDFRLQAQKARARTAQNPSVADRPTALRFGGPPPVAAAVRADRLIPLLAGSF